MNFWNSLFKRRWLYHIAYWATIFIFYITIFSLDPENDKSYATNAKQILLSFVPLMPPVYFNLLFLIPNYLFRKKYLQYAVLLTLTVLVCVPIVFVIWHALSDNPQEFAEEFNDNRLVYFIIAVFNIGMSIVITTGLKLAKRWFNQQQRNRELQNKNLQTELNFLKSQVNPHFLFNTLNNLYSLTLQKDDRAPDTVLKLSGMMRYMLYECNEPQVLLEKEVNCVKNYLDLEKIRQGDRCDIQFNLKGDLNGQQIAPLLFIPFIENSFKHGVNNQIGTGFVHIDLEVNGKDLELKVTNGKSKQKEPSSQPGGIGLKNVKRRLDLIYPKKHILNIQEQNDAFEVDLKLDLS